MIAPLKPRPEPKRKDFSDNPIRLALIGTGFGSSVHLPALAHVDHTELVAICSRRQERATAIAARHGVPTASTDWRDVVTDPGVDAVIIATPPYLHHQMVIAAIEAGKHVLCEKPLARNLAETRDMARLAEHAKVVAMVNHQYRYLPIRRRVKELIDEGYIGDPQSVSMIVFNSNLADPEGTRFTWLMEADKAGGMLRAFGSHYIDTLRWWLGDIDGVAGAATGAPPDPNRHGDQGEPKQPSEPCHRGRSNSEYSDPRDERKLETNRRASRTMTTRQGFHSRSRRSESLTKMPILAPRRSTTGEVQHVGRGAGGRWLPLFSWLLGRWENAEADV